jgi:RNA polymerase sigma factor (TIGR02999 family)
MMRQILIDFARARSAGKRGHGSTHVHLSGIREVRAGESSPIDFLDLEAALDELAALDPRQAQVVELRYFGGLENPEVAAVLGVSEPTVIRDWRAARAFLFDRLQPQ